MGDMDDVVCRLGRALLGRGEMIVTAESCSGGSLAAMMTAVPGSSAWFERGYVVYSDAAKRECLDVCPATLATYGPVSQETATEMAQGALANSHAQIGVAVTGIAGPGGAIVGKPVGTVYFAWIYQDGASRGMWQLLEGDRQEVCAQACELALQGSVDLIEYVAGEG